ncbi:penicillin-binding protein 1A [Kinneretia asaccharophila]|uniref:Penicillin-binding protein 1A n=1 Tax=Roseateles asaccharophilus TaxID=582607 RepID=A0A4R6N2J5_9BURK|nr:penicillin-binding protein 1A [Roseateles asaccharophilus]MDN3544084.1 penicillin-binding protein 1A [Roseateles asaccharophilus]TDP09321.1 penicillin-binding protein 1A [Roseateles asaccharophilus]
MSDPKKKTPQRASSESEHPSHTAHPALSFLGRSLAWLLGLAVAGATAVLILVGLGLAMAYPNLPDIQGLTDYRPKLPLRVLSAEGTLLGEFGEERRNYLPVQEIPKVMKDAVLAIEDARFYQHGGVDYLGVIRAGLANVSDSRSQGASTITMQVARNFYLSSEKTFVRKIYEILLALKIENALPKDKILEIYMNQIFLGHRAYGFAAASEVYFGKQLKDISIAEAAMLAGLPKAPSAYNPISNPRRATVRQRHIIDRMLENGFISEEQHLEAKAQKLRYRPQMSENTTHAEYVAELARQMIFNQYGEDTYSRGLNVYLTVRADEQMSAYRALRRGIMDYERRQVYRGPEAFVDLPADPADLDARVAEALSDHPANDELLPAVVLSAEPKKVVAALQNGDSIEITGEGLKPATSGLSDKGNPKTRIRRGAVIRVLQTGGNKPFWTITQLPEVEGAFVSLDPRNGNVRAMVGGFDYAKNKFNHVTQAWRQPGSAFKPFIYSAALEKGFTPSTVVNDAPLFFDASTTGSQPWEPKNYDGTFDGPMPLRKALAKSKNMVSIRVLQSTGVHFAQDWVGRFGFEAEKHPAYLTMALGAGSVTPMLMAQGYAVFANGGHLLTPRLIAKLTDDKGRLLYEAPALSAEDTPQVIEPRNAFLMSQLLQEVTRSGTAARAQSTLKRPDLYGKTGTTNDSMDAWFAGYQREVVAVVWIGYDQPRKLGSRETGGGLSLPVWIEYMSYALRNVPVAEYAAPEGVVQLNGEWYYDEYAGNEGVRSLNNEASLPKEASPEEKKSILDLFKR